MTDDPTVPDSDAIRHRMNVQAFQAAATEARRAARKAAKIAAKGKLDPAEIEDSIAAAVDAWKAVRRPGEESRSPPTRNE